MKRLMALVMELLLLPVMAAAATIHVPTDQPTIAEEATLGLPKIILSDTTCFYSLFAHIVPPDSPALCEAKDTIWVWNGGTVNLHLQLDQSNLPQQSYAEFLTPLDSNVILPHDVAAIEITGCHDGSGGSEYTNKCVYSIPGEYEGYLEIVSNDPLNPVVRVVVTRSIPEPMLPSIGGLPSAGDVFYWHRHNLIGYYAQTFCGPNPPVDIQVSCGQAPTWNPSSGGFNFWPTATSDSCVIVLSVTDQLGRTASAETYVKVVRQYDGPVWYVSLGGDDETGTGSESLPFRTLQFGITTADPGDTVVASSGAYSPVVIDKPLTLLGSDGAASTEIVGLPNTRCVFVSSGVDTVVINGFTLRNGLPSSSAVSPYGQGGGLLSVGSNVRIANCVVTGNGSYSSGGGLAFRDSSYFEIVNTRICANSASQSGGGIVAIDAKGCKISNTVIDSNEASLNGGGLFIYSSSVNPAMAFELKNCVIAGNTAHEHGMGIGARRNSLSVSNCIVYANHAASGAASPYGVYVSAGSLSLRCSDLYMNDQANLFAESISDSSSNISLGPLFCDPTVGDFHISRCSPCAPANNGCHELIGRYGAGCDSGCPPGSLTWHVAVVGSDLSGDGTREYPLATIQRGLDLTRDGDTVLIMPGVYYESSYYEFGYTRDIWIVGEAGADSTILNPADSGTSILSLVASCWGEIRSSYHISGLTFQGSLGASALHLTHTQSEMASFVVSNCRFINNSAPHGAGVFLGAFGGYERRDSLSNNVFEYNSGGRGTGICLGGTGVKQSPLNPLDTLVVLGNRFVHNSGISIFQVEFSPIGSPALKVIENLFQGNTADSTISEGGNEWSNWIGNRWIGNKVNGGSTIHNTGLARHHNFYVSNSFVENEFVSTPGTCLFARGRHLHLDRNLCVATRNGTGIVAPDTSGGWWTIEITCNNSWGNTFDNYVCVNLDTSNLSLDPEFCDAANGNFQVKQSSPCAPSNNGCGVLIGALGIGCLYGDADGDGSITIADAVFLINYIFIGGPAPEPLSIGDTDCSGDINIADAVIIINYIFSGGPAPCAM